MNDPHKWLDELAAVVRDPEFVARNSAKFRAPLKSRTQFGPAGRAVIHSAGERVIYGPNGAALCRVVEDEVHNTQIEEADRLHATVRPNPIRMRLPFGAPTPRASAAAQPAAIRSAFRAKGPT